MKTLKKNDKVVVLTGKDKGKRGKVIEIFSKKGKIKVEGVALVTRHVKPRRQGESGGIKREEGYISASNVMVICPSQGKPCRLNRVERG